MLISFGSAASRPGRTAWVVVLVLLHLFVAPCATAMILMSADVDCDHCQVTDGSEACIVASQVSNSVIGNVAFDSGRADPPIPSGTPALLLLAKISTPLPRALTAEFWSRSFATRHSGDPPLYLLLGQLRI